MDLIVGRKTGKNLYIVLHVAVAKTSESPRSSGETLILRARKMLSTNLEPTFMQSLSGVSQFETYESSAVRAKRCALWKDCRIRIRENLQVSPHFDITEKHK
jgi:hypothetical protein